MQQPRAHHLWPHDCVQCRRIELHQQSVLQHTRRVHDTPDRRPALGMKFVKKTAQLCFIGYINRRQVHACSQQFQFADGGDLPGQASSGCGRHPVRAWWQSCASQKDQPSGALLDHPSCDQQAEVSQASADQVAGVCPPTEGRSLRDRGAQADQTTHVSLPLTKRELILAIGTGDFLAQLVSGRVTR